MNDAVRVVGNSNLVKIVDPVFGAKPLMLFIEPLPRFGFGQVPQLHRRRDQFRRFIADNVCPLKRLPPVTHGDFLRDGRRKLFSRQTTHHGDRVALSLWGRDSRQDPPWSSGSADTRVR